ncbi:WS/DGAT/MGAT family O-acyltransferase [Mycobacterium sp. ML4]
MNVIDNSAEWPPLSNESVDNVIDLADQAMFLGEQATGATGLLQCAWVYHRSIDLEGLRTFHRHLQRGRLCRSIERSPLPFGRHRWVIPRHLADIEIVRSARPRAEFDTWLVEQANTALDAEHGPPWHLAVLPFVEGGAGVSLVLSHCLADGLGLCEALADAASGRDSTICWPAAGSRRRSRLVRADIRRIARDLPATGRALGALARMAWRGQSNAAPAAGRSAGRNERLTMPMATVFLAGDEWDSRAHATGGTSNALFAAVAARLAQRVGRVAVDGSLVLAMPVNERIPGDTRANAVSNADIAVERVPNFADLREIRATIREALIRHNEVPNERWALMPLVPFLPKRLVKRLVGVAAGPPNTVIASNLGALDPAVTRADGTPADCFAMMSLFPGVTTSMMRTTGGRLALASGRVHGRIFISVLAYQPGRLNTTDVLRQDLLSTLEEFALTATAGWPQPGPLDDAA